MHSFSGGRCHAALAQKRHLKICMGKQYRIEMALPMYGEYQYQVIESLGYLSKVQKQQIRNLSCLESIKSAGRKVDVPARFHQRFGSFAP
jgi:hypothetical protein